MLIHSGEIGSLALELSDDHRTFKPFFEFCKPALIQASCAGYTLDEMISDLVHAGEFIQTQQTTCTFRIRIDSGTRELFIYSQLKRKAEKIFHPAQPVFSGEDYAKYKNLTRSERMYLNFFYHGYNDNSISDVFKISPETLRVHRKNIYAKMGFHNRSAMILWAERHLRMFMRREDLPQKYLVK